MKVKINPLKLLVVAPIHPLVNASTSSNTTNTNSRSLMHILPIGPTSTPMHADSLVLVLVPAGTQAPILKPALPLD